MRETDNSKNLQVILSYSLIVVSVIMLIFSLGFMTNFYRLFVDGTSEMYEYYKDLQMLNNAIFNATIICLVLSLGLIAFDVTKKKVGISGSIYSVIVATVVALNAPNVLRVASYFEELYAAMDFSALEEYTTSMFPFAFSKIIIIVAAVLAILTAIMTCANIQLRGKKESEIDE